MVTLKQHTHINYCEAVIFPDGTLSYAIPSHQEMLLKIYSDMVGIYDREQLWNSIPVYEYDINWLPNKTGCAIVWYEHYLLPENATDKQKNTVKNLVNNGIMSKKLKTMYL